MERILPCLTSANTYKAIKWQYYWHYSAQIVGIVIAFIRNEGLNMENERILILDSDLYRAGMLGEQIALLGYLKVYLSENRETFDDLVQANYFKYVFIHNDIVSAIEEQIATFSLMCFWPYIILMNSDSDLNKLRKPTCIWGRNGKFDFYSQKPADFTLLSKILEPRENRGRGGPEIKCAKEE